MAVKFIEYRIAKYGCFDGFVACDEDRMHDDSLNDEVIGDPFWSLEGIVPSEVYSPFEVCRGTFEHCVEVYRYITGHEAKIAEPGVKREYAVEGLPT